jgi:hypothetical protein
LNWNVQLNYLRLSLMRFLGFENVLPKHQKNGSGKMEQLQGLGQLANEAGNQTLMNCKEHQA